MKKVVVVSAVRTSGGSFGGSFKSITAVDLGSNVIKESISRANILGTEVGQVIFANGWQSGVGPNPARLCSVVAGLPVTVPAFTVNMRCGSSLRAIQLGVLSIAAGEEEVIVAGGTESSSNVPYLLTGARWGYRMGDNSVKDGLHKDGFMCPLAKGLMGESTELLVEKYNITREEQDKYAFESQQKAIRAEEEGLFKDEIVPIEIQEKKATRVIDHEEIPRKDTSIEKLANLKPVFKKDGTITAGNSCALCDASASVVLMSEEKANQMGIKPLALIHSYSYIALEPKYFGLGPVSAINKALSNAKMDINDMDLIEINEAFAAQVLACERELKFKREKLNINGGAIALGHPVGATGAKILTTLIYALKNYNKTLGIVSLGIGGGQGVAMVIERLN